MAEVPELTLTQQVDGIRQEAVRRSASLADRIAKAPAERSALESEVARLEEMKAKVESELSDAKNQLAQLAQLDQLESVKAESDMLAKYLERVLDTVNEKMAAFNPVPENGTAVAEIPEPTGIG